MRTILPELRIRHCVVNWDKKPRFIVREAGALSYLGVLVFFSLTMSALVSGSYFARTAYAQVAPQTCEKLDVRSATASAYRSGQEPWKTIDNDFRTGWVTSGSGNWIEVELATESNVCFVDISWFRGDVRQYDFEISTSTDGFTYSKVYAGESSGTTFRFESYDTADSLARYVKITINGNSENMRSAIKEIAVYGNIDSVAPVILPPPDISVTGTGTLTPVSLGYPAVSDNLDPSPVVVNSAPEGGFPVGATNVVWTATDASGNTASAVQLVAVTAPPSPPSPTKRIGIFVVNTGTETQQAASKHLDMDDYVGNFRLHSLQNFHTTRHVLAGQSISVIQDYITNVIPNSSVRVDTIGYDNEANNGNLSTPAEELVDPAMSTNEAVSMIKKAGYKASVGPTRSILLQEYQRVDWTKVDEVGFQLQKVVTSTEFKRVAELVGSHIKAQNPNCMIYLQVNPSLNTMDEINAALKSVDHSLYDGVGIMWNGQAPAPSLDEVLTKIHR